MSYVINNQHLNIQLVHFKEHSFETQNFVCFIITRVTLTSLLSVNNIQLSTSFKTNLISRRGSNLKLNHKACELCMNTSVRTFIMNWW